MAAWPTEHSFPLRPLSDPLVDVAFFMLEIGESIMHVNARGPTETQLSTALEILCIKEQRWAIYHFQRVQHSSTWF